MKLNRVLLEEATDGSLLGGEVSTSAETTTENTEAPSWYYSAPGEDNEGVGGNGEVPEWFKVDKYKSIEEQAKGYNELSKKFGDFTGAPEQYEMAEDLGFDAEDPMLKGFQEIAKEANMGNDTFNKILTNYASHMEQMQEAQREQAMAELGENAQQRVQDVYNWVNTNMTKEEVEAVMPMVQTAEQMKVMESLIAKTKNSSLANNNAQQSVKMSQSEYAEQLMAKDNSGNLKIATDPDYKKRMDEMAKQFM